jgi:hypothetical protein
MTLAALSWVKCRAASRAIPWKLLEAGNERSEDLITAVSASDDDYFVCAIFLLRWYCSEFAMDHIQQERHFGQLTLIEANAKTKQNESVVQLVDIGADRICKYDGSFCQMR